MKTMKIETALVKGKRMLRLYFTYDLQLVQELKKIEGTYWNMGLRCWMAPHSRIVVHRLGEEGNKTGWYMPDLERLNHEFYFRGINKSISEEKEKSIEAFADYLRSRRYSARTVISYSEGLRTFMEFIGEKPMADITDRDMVDFNIGYIVPGHYSWSYQNQVISALKIYFRQVLHQEGGGVKLERPRSGRHLPDIFSVEEVEKLLKSIRNSKHRAALSVIYACGLRRSELINLRLRDVDSKRKLLIIKGAKGDKDRVVPLPEKVIEMLREYYKLYKPEEWLFEGSVKGQQWSETSLRAVFVRALEATGIKKQLTLHSLRHTYATHLLESGVDLRFIQELLGHKSSRTTEIYTHVMSRSIEGIKSPFEKLKL
jgi:integrase/recombinase XerD